MGVKKDPHPEDENPIEIDDNDDEEEGRYVVEEILDRRYNEGKNRMEYFLKWKNWDPGFNSWEPVECLDSCEDLKNKFDEKFEAMRKNEERDQRGEI